MSEKKFWLTSLLGFAVLFIAVAWFVNDYYMDRNIRQISERFLLLSNLRREALEQYFATAQTELTFWSTNKDLVTKQIWLANEWQRYRDTEGDPKQALQQTYIEHNPYPAGERRKLTDSGSGSGYGAMHAEFHPMARLFVVERGYYDFFLISPVGNIHYTVEKENDFGTNLLAEEWRNTGLADAFARALEYADEGKVAISDLEPYAPSGGVPALFMARAMKDEQGEVVGVIAFQLPTARIISIMNFTAGMGESGETYLVGKDLLMRSNSRFSDTSTILRTTVDTDTVRRALQGESGVRFTPDYRGVEVLSAYTSVQIDRNRWAVMAEIDRAEIMRMASDERPWVSGIILFLYGLSLWSAWYLRGADFESDGSTLAGLDFDSDLGDA